MYQDSVTVLNIDQTFQLPQPIDTLVSVNVEPSQLVETNEGVRGMLDLLITYEPCEETENETALTHDALLITDIKATETKKVCAYFSFPMELYGVSEKTHLVVSELDYLLPTRSTFTLKANVQIAQPNTQEDEAPLLTAEKLEPNTHQLDERVMDEDVLIYTPEKQLDHQEAPSFTVAPERVQQDTNRNESHQSEETTNETNQLKEATRDITSQKVNDLTAGVLTESETSMEAKDVVETREENEVTVKEVDEKTTRVIYQHYGLKGLANPRVKLPCVIVKDEISLSD